MTFQLELTGENKSRRYATMLHLMISFLLIGLGGACTVLYWFTAISPKFQDIGPVVPFLILGLLCIAVGIAVLMLNIFGKSWLRQEKNNFIFRLAELILLGGGAALFFMAGWQVPAAMFGLMAAVILFAIFQERRSGGPQVVTIDNNGIQLPAATFRSHLPWAAVNKVLLRYGILTIDTVDNKLWQRDVTTPVFDSAALETFCTMHIEEHRSSRRQEAVW